MNIYAAILLLLQVATAVAVVILDMKRRQLAKDLAAEKSYGALKTKSIRNLEDQDFESQSTIATLRETVKRLMAEREETRVIRNGVDHVAK